MKRIGLVFFLAILLPSILLAVLAIRSVRDQSLILNSQRALLYQSSCDSVAAEINLFMDEVRVFHGQLVEELVARRQSGLVETFDETITDAWSQASVGAVVSRDGVIVSPVDGQSGDADRFLANHRDFLTNERTVEVYEAPPVLSSDPLIVEEVVSPKWQKASSGDAVAVASPSENELAEAQEIGEPEKSQLKVGVAQNKLEAFRFESLRSRSATAPPAAESVELEAAGADRAAVTQPRNVLPTQSVDALPGAVAPLSQGAPGVQALSNVSRLNASALKSNELTESESGAVSRLIDGDLHILLWERSAALPGFTFWTELDLTTIREDLTLLFSQLPFASHEAVSLALLDSDGLPVAQTEKGFTTDWSRPFVAAEVGQILPRWEVAAYLLNPDSLDDSAKTLRWTLSLIVVSLLIAVGVGTLLIFKAVGYEMQLATRKTDFVSNVSHELKTPLTSIRMFSELLASDGKTDPETTRNYSGIIQKESERLSRLINRLLDFSRLDRDEMTLKREAVDLRGLIEGCLETVEMPMEERQVEISLSCPDNTPLVVEGDPDALEQVVLNLLSNAEKYAGSGGEILVEIESLAGRAVLRILDRGPGIPRNLREKIFEKFYRIDDSIHAGVEGSGIGLALCRQLVDKHGGEIRCEPRPGGGSAFVVELPLMNNDEEK